MRGGQRIDLQQQELKLLEYLMLHAGEVVTRAMLLENVWSFHFDPKTNVIESHMSRLRAKVDRGFGKELIQTLPIWSCFVTSHSAPIDLILPQVRVYRYICLT